VSSDELKQKLSPLFSPAPAHAQERLEPPVEPARGVNPRAPCGLECPWILAAALPEQNLHAKVSSNGEALLNVSDARSQTSATAADKEK
jgi:hypothetical protein